MSANALIVGDGATEIERMLLAMAIEPMRLSSSAEAIAALRTVVFSLVIVTRSSALAPFELVREIRRRIARHNTYLVFVSDEESSTDLAEALAAGADDCFADNASTADLMGRIEMARSRIQLRRQ